LSATVFTLRQSTDGFTVENVLRGGYWEPGLSFNKVPEFQFTVGGASGIDLYRYFVGKEIQIRRNAVLDFTGIIDTPDGEQGSGATTTTLSGVHKGYVRMGRLPCTNYDWDEDGEAATTRDAVTVNPWGFFVFRKPNGTLDINGLPPAVDGVPIETVMQACIGTRFPFQIDFQDNSLLRASQIYATGNTSQVYRDGAASQTRPAFQRVRQGSTFAAGTAIESVPLYNGDRNISLMGTISSVSILLIGVRNALSQNPTMRVCRNATEGTRTFTSVTLTYSANYNGSGLDAWAGSVSLSGSETVKNALGLEITLGGSASDTSTTAIYYAKAIATTAADTGLTEGTIETYANPIAIGGAENWLEMDLQGKSRLDAVEAIRQVTESDESVNPSPHWDAWIDGSLTFHFKQRRGATVAKTYSFANGNLRKIGHEHYGRDLAYQTIAYGAGSGNAQTRIVSKMEFSSGGLYDSDRDPTVGGTLYGERPRVVDFVDSNERSPVNLLRKARASHKFRRTPQEKIQVEITADPIQYFVTGDSVTISNLATRTSATPRVVSLKRSWGGNVREKLSVELGEGGQRTFADFLSGSQSTSKDLTIHTVPQDSATGLSGNGLYFDKDRYGVYSLNLADGSLVERVMLRLDILPWQATAKTVATAVYKETNTNQTGGTAVADNATLTQAFTASSTARNGTLYTVQAIRTSGAQPLIGELKFVNTTDGATYMDVFNNPGADTNQSRVTLTTNEVSSANNGDTMTATWTNRSGGSQTVNLLITENLGSDRLTFGIYQFDGDSGLGTGSPKYGRNIRFSTDPADADNDGIPSGAEFDATKHPVFVGSSQSIPSSIEVDITGWLTTEANGIIKSGVHRVYFIGVSDTSNAQGLSVVGITPVIKFRNSGGGA
jgi:hypothetical protein